MNDIEKLKYDLAMHAAMAKTVVECQKEQITAQARFLANFEVIYKQYSESENFSKKIAEINNMIDNSN